MFLLVLVVVVVVVGDKVERFTCDSPRRGTGGFNAR
eukprot:gene41218-38543_t